MPGRDHNYLFRWAGKHLEPGLKSTDGRLPKLKPEIRQRYLELLSETLNQGLYAGVPKDDFLGDGGAIKLTRPCLCLTELRLGESGEHWRQYGRMAFGFTKSFIAQAGGGAVSYVNGSKNSPLVKALERLKRQIHTAENKNGHAELEFVWHFFKRLKDAPKTKRRAVSSKEAAQATPLRAALSKDEQEARQAMFPRTMAMPYLDEHEWRLVWSPGQRWGAAAGDLPPAKARFQCIPGRELQVVVVPDNYALQLALQHPAIAKHISAPPGSGNPPVQLLSLEAIVRI